MKKKNELPQFSKDQLENFFHEQNRLAQRIEYHGPKISWPIRKLDNETPNDLSRSIPKSN